MLAVIYKSDFAFFPTNYIWNHQIKVINLLAKILRIQMFRMKFIKMKKSDFYYVEFLIVIPLTQSIYSFNWFPRWWICSFLFLLFLSSIYRHNRCDKMLSMHRSTDISRREPNTTIMCTVYGKWWIHHRLSIFNDVLKKSLLVYITRWYKNRNRQPKLCRPKIHRTGE